jgi:hypothetical protein
MANRDLAIGVAGGLAVAVFGLGCWWIGRNTAVTSGGRRRLLPPGEIPDLIECAECGEYFRLRGRDRRLVAAGMMRAPHVCMDCEEAG